MQADLVKEWKNVLNEELGKPYFAELIKRVTSEYDAFKCYPERSDIFNALNCCPPEKVKVVIIGQDPYHGPGQAHGLSFSVNDGVVFPPSLQNIFKEINSDLGTLFPPTGNLRRWAEQGVLLLNATLTVRAASPGSHQKMGWEIFTDAVIRILSEQQDGIVFMLWGGYARSKAKLIDSSKHLILEAGHPSPLSANRGLWFGNRHFSKANEYLVRHGKSSVNW